MAVLRQPLPSDNEINYVGTLGIFLGISCTVLMLRFKGFRAVLNLSSKPEETGVVEGISVTSVSIRGAYRPNTDEFYEYGTLTQSSNSRITPTMVKLPPSQTQLRPTKSVNDITQPGPGERSATPEVIVQAQSTSNVNKQKPEKNKNNKKEQQKAAKLEKEKLAQQKKRDKIAANEQAKQGKLRREREKKQAKETKKRDKDKPPAAPAPTPSPRNNPLAQPQQPTNTRESSISQSVGPPPYDEVPKPVTKNDKDTTGNTSFSKPVENDSWDLVSKHREQMVRPTSNIGGGKPKQMVLDLKFDRMGPAARPSTDSEADA